MSTEQSTWKPHQDESTEAVPRGGTTRSSQEVPDKGMERRGGGVEPHAMSQPVMGGADACGKVVGYFHARSLGSVYKGQSQRRSSRSR
jgi:hypothetical protein